MCKTCAILVLAGSAAWGASPHLSNIDPAGIQRGAETEVTISGDRLQDAKGLLFYEETPGIEVTAWQYRDGAVRAKLKAAPDCPLGEHHVRVWTATGITELLPLFVSPFPNVASSGSNHTAANAQPVALNCTVNGVIRAEQIDYYSVKANKGDRLTAEVEGMRLGREFFDPWAAILDATGRQLAANDDNALLVQDPLVSIVVPADGTYIVAVRDSSWGGTDRSWYRLHVGTFPQPMAVFPPGGKADDTLPVTYLCDAKGTLHGRLHLPAEATPRFYAEASDGGLSAPGPLPVRVSPFANVLETPGNTDIAHATDAGTPPLAFNGIIDRPRAGYFKFHAKAGAVLDMTVYARQLRSPLDSAMDLMDAKGNHLGGNDDSIGPDSYLRYTIPRDGDYFISIHDHLWRGGPGYIYRVEIVPVEPSVTFTMPEIVRNSQERQTIVIPRGNRWATMLRMKREGFDGEMRLDMPSLLPGVTIQTGSRAGDLLPVVFSAAPDAAIGATLTDVVAHPADPAKHVGGGYQQEVELTHGSPNDYPYLKAAINRLALSVADEAPFRIDLVPPAVPIQQDGQGTLTVRAVRRPGFSGAINVSMLYNPPGLNSQAVTTIPDKQESVDIPINANGDAKARTWQVAVIASADAGAGVVWASSDLEPLTVVKPFISARIDRAGAVQGQPASVLCHLDQNVPFDGKAHVRLMGLPNKATAPDADITAADKQIEFHVTTDATTPPGSHKDLFCEITVEKAGVKMVAHTAYGGALRIDRANVPKKEVAAK